MHKLWIYYLDVEDPVEYPAASEECFIPNSKFKSNNLVNVLYAFTDVKKYAEEFEHTRDMKKFNVVKITEEDDEFFPSMKALKMDYQQFELEFNVYSSLALRPTKNNKKEIYTKEYEILSTGVEYSIVDDIFSTIESTVMTLFHMMMNCTHESREFTNFIDFKMADRIINQFINCFNKDIQEAFSSLMFYDIIMDYLGMDYASISDVPFRVYEEDQLEMFCQTFSNTFRKGWS